MEAAGTIFRDVYGINRCIWNLAGGTPRSFEPQAATVTRERLDLLREADALVMDGLRRHESMTRSGNARPCWSPARSTAGAARSSSSAPIHSERAMTAGRPALPDALIAELRRRYPGPPRSERAGLDVTSKPPGTIEWE